MDRRTFLKSGAIVAAQPTIASTDMERFNTGNPIDSDNPKDLYDNSKNLDQFVNSTSKISQPDRFGVERKTWHGMEEEFAEFLAGSSYELLGDYAAGITLESYNQVVRYNGEVYAAALSTDLPYILDGTWATDELFLVNRGEGLLRQDLASSDGAELVGLTATKKVSDLKDTAPGSGAALIGNVVQLAGGVTDLRDLEPSASRNINLKYHTTLGDGGGGLFYAVTGASPGTYVDDDGRIIVPNGGDGSAAWIRDADNVRLDQYGGADSGIEAAANYADSSGVKIVHLSPGVYDYTGFAIPDGVSFVGKGAVFQDLGYRVGAENRIGAPRFKLPDGLSWAPFAEYSVDSIGNCFVDVDVEQLWLDNEVKGIVAYYVDWTNGSDSNGGTMPNAALKTIKAAAQKGDVGIIYLMPGTHFNGLNSYSPTRDIEIRSFSGSEVIIRMGEDPAAYSFSVTGGTAYTYEATISRQIRAVFDETLPDSKGGYRQMTLRASSTEVNNNPGSWFYDTGTNKLYVRMFTNRAPGVDLVLLTTAQNILHGDQAMFLKNVKIEGGDSGFIATATGASAVPRLYMQDCRLFYSQNFGIDSNGAKTYMERVEGAYSGLDIFNYHSAAGVDPLAIEIDCTGRDAGSLTPASPENKNGSSIHDGGSIIRINGSYYGNYGPNVIDTTTGVSLNVGTIAKNSIAPTSTQNLNFAIGASGFSGIMYCHRTHAARSVYDYYSAGGTSKLNVAEGSDSGLFGTGSPGDSVVQYWPEIA